jgi:hypothetical protein
MVRRTNAVQNLKMRLIATYSVAKKYHWHWEILIFY